MKRMGWFLVGVMVAAISGALSAADVSVLQPNDPSLSAEQRATLYRAADELGRLLDTPLHASKRSLGATGWTHAQFAAYTAGWLSARGYRVLLARNMSASATPDTWVLVEVPVAGTALYLPVNASPPAGVIQTRLGTVPLVSGRFDPAFVTFDQTTPLPANAPPVARVVAALRSMDSGGTVFFFDGTSSQDPDGVIVLYIWTWSEREQFAQRFSTASHTFREAGTFNVWLTVVDQLGAMATTTVSVDVRTANTDVDRSATPSRPPCGCGG